MSELSASNSEGVIPTSADPYASKAAAMVEREWCELS